MKGYLGEEKLNKSETKFAMYSKQDWVLLWIEMYGGIDGQHHKKWLLDQIVRILHDTEIIIKQASWDNGHKEYRFSLGEPTKQYWDWVKYVKSDEEGEDAFDYEFGIAP